MHGSAVLDFDADKLAEAAAIRAAQQSMVRESGRSHLFIIAEAALAWEYGGPTVMAAQLEWLTSAAEWPGVDVRVIPFGAVEIPIGVGFAIYDDLAMIETWTATDREDRSDLQPVVDLLTSAASSPAESVAIIKARSEAIA